MNINIGDLRERVTLQTAVLTSDGGGGSERNWQDLAEVWASVAPVGADGRFEAEQVTLPVTYQITVRYDSALTGARRIMLRGQGLTVLSVINAGIRDRWMVFRAVEEVKA